APLRGDFGLPRFHPHHASVRGLIPSSAANSFAERPLAFHSAIRFFQTSRVVRCIVASTRGDLRERPRRVRNAIHRTDTLRLLVDDHDLDASERTCSVCNGTLEEMGDEAEVMEEIDVLAREFVRRKHVRKKYRCRCGGCVKTAPMPARLIPGG